jgi:hypothetical protein
VVCVKAVTRHHVVEALWDATTQIPRPTVHVSKCHDLLRVNYDRFNIVADNILPLVCAHIGS